jgi:hypothetical protein
MWCATIARYHGEILLYLVGGSMMYNSSLVAFQTFLLAGFGALVQVVQCAYFGFVRKVVHGLSISGFLVEAVRSLPILASLKRLSGLHILGFS